MRSMIIGLYLAIAIIFSGCDCDLSAPRYRCTVNGRVYDNIIGYTRFESHTKLHLENGTTVSVSGTYTIEPMLKTIEDVPQVEAVPKTENGNRRIL